MAFTLQVSKQKVQVSKQKVQVKLIFCSDTGIVTLSSLSDLFLN